jgi:hypothetical protein
MVRGGLPVPGERVGILAAWVVLCLVAPGAGAQPASMPVVGEAPGQAVTGGVQGPESAGAGEVASPPEAESVPVLSAPGSLVVTVDRPAPPVRPVDLLDTLGRGTGPGLPWQFVLVIQLFFYGVVDAVPFMGCVVGSWLASLAVPFGGLLLPIVLSVLLIPPVATMSGCGSGALLQWLGDRMGTQRGRLACVGCTSVSLSVLTYALVIAPITIGMGFLAIAAYSYLSTQLVLRFLPRGVLPGVLELTGYSALVGGTVLAVAVVVVGALLAPVLGFLVRPPVVALVYRLTDRAREPGEDMWPPSLVGERSDRLPLIGRAEPGPWFPSRTPPREEPPGDQRF